MLKVPKEGRKAGPGAGSTCFLLRLLIVKSPKRTGDRSSMFNKMMGNTGTVGGLTGLTG